MESQTTPVVPPGSAAGGTGGTATDTGTGGAATATATTPTVPPESVEGGAGDEEPIRIPAVFAVGSGTVAPPAITVPARIPVALELTSSDDAPHVVVLRTPTAVTLAVPARGAQTQVLEGLPAGRYALTVDGTATDGALVVGGDAGP